MTCETLPLCPDTTLDADRETALTEPVEVGPFPQGVVFVRLVGGGAVDAEIGISPSGYEDWDEHWTAMETMALDEPGMHAARLENFGNWLRLRLRLRDGDDATVLAWFVGDG